MTTSQGQIQCPFCAEQIHPQAAVCRHCNRKRPTGMTRAENIGQRYMLGMTEHGFGVWDKAGGTQPLGIWPDTDGGWQAASHYFYNAESALSGPVGSDSRAAIVGPLLILVGIAAAVYFLLLHPSVHVPLTGEQECGGNSWTIGTASLGDFSGTQDALSTALNQECINQGRSNLYKGGGALIVGVIAGSMVTAFERKRI